MTIRQALVVALLLLADAGPGFGYDRPLTGPQLGASTDFGQTSRPQILAGSAALPLAVMRDEIFWQNVETDRGRFGFDTPLTTYPDLLPPLGAKLLFLVNNPHPNHDGGTTPHTSAGAQAFARYTIETLRRFPGIDTVEVGNEMNSQTFAWGPGWDGAMQTRAASYVRLLAATSQAVRAERPGATILGGAAHSIPVAWFHEIFALGAAAYMDALVIHPYTVRPEQLARQIAVLRREVPQTANLPIAVTEFGQTDAATAPAYLMKSYCQQAISGVTQADWYPLNPRGDGLAALLTPEGGLTPVGETFRYIRANFEGRPVEDIAPDPFSYGCRFGANRMVLWGEPRDVTLAAGVQVFDLSGQALPTDAAFRLSPDVPLVLAARTGPLRLGHEVRLGPSGMIADSWHQFAYPEAEGATDPFERLIRQGGQETPLGMRPGQERDGVPWTPYLGTDIDGIARASAEWVLPSSPLNGPIDIVYRYRVPRPVEAIVEVRLAPWDGGVLLSINLNGRTLQSANVTANNTITLDPLSLATGDVIEVVAGPNGSGGGSGLRAIVKESGD
ncbi:MAG: hypothetical protein ABI832_12315 [bacterium]